MKDITVNTKLAAIIGTDIGHSKSPAMMNAAFQKLGLDAYYYAMNIKEEDFGTVVKGISKMNFMGLTLTIPYKIQILQYLDEIDPLAEIIGAVNTIKIQDGRMIGYNTDGAGFVRGLEVDCGLMIEDQVYFVVGCRRCITGDYDRVGFEEARSVSIWQTGHLAKRKKSVHI